MQESSDHHIRIATGLRSLQLHEGDNVAVVLGNTKPGLVEVLGPAAGAVVVKKEIAHGHKIALWPLAEGDAVVKCGVTIGFATATIEAGDWVHTHNCRSGLDERSHTLDPHSGAATDTQYV
jgi:hypothetical protein